MYTTLKLIYKDGTKRRFTTEPCGGMTARSLLSAVLGYETDVVMGRYYDDIDKANKPIKMWRA